MNKLSEDSRKHLITMLIVFFLVLLTSGIQKGFIVLFIILFSGLAVIGCLWIVAFLIGCLVTKSLHEAWRELNPKKMIKECFFDNNEE